MFDGQKNKRMRFGDALTIVLSQLISYFLLALLYFKIESVQQGRMSFSDAAFVAMFTANFIYPFLLLAIAFSISTLFAWKSSILLRVLATFGLFMQVLYLINLAIVLSGGEVISL